ncbi:MAG: permease prefix domain 1-containing protein [Pyrinomonadaceae bacterium]|nr:permease prefix domain 1-containing protein [Pyrinomonadaceae bacterium]
MKSVTGRIFTRVDSEDHKREIEEQLNFHLDLLTQEYLQKDVSPAEAKDAALRRFGNVELIKDECLEISSRSHRMMPAMKVFLAVVFLAGVLVRINSTDTDLSHMGDLLIVVPMLGRLLFYLRGLKPSRLPADVTKSPLMLNEAGLPPIMIYDHRKLTPVERVISDK